MSTSLSSPVIEAPVAAGPLRLVVPVDASRASVHAVALAIQIAQQGLSEIMLVALGPEPHPEDGPDPELMEALLMETEMGLGLGQILPELDEKARVQQRYELVLMPLERRVAAAGVPVKLRVLRGENLGQQLRELLKGNSPRPAVVLSNPLKLFGPLRELTSEFWANPHDVTYISGLVEMPRRRFSLLRSIFGRNRRQGDERVASPTV